MVRTLTLAKWLKEKINQVAEKPSPEGFKYQFKVWPEVRKIKGLGDGTCIEGRLHKNSSTNIPTAGFNSSMAEYSVDFFVSAPQGGNGHVINTLDILDEFVKKENGQYIEINDGRVLLVFDNSIAQSYLEQYNGCDDFVVLTLRFSAQWTPNVIEDTEEIKEGQIEIKLINRTPYHNRKIDMNEEDKVVLKLNTTVVGWTHDEVSAVLKVKLPATFVAEYTYAQITEFNGRVTRWFVLGKQIEEPQVWTLTLKRDLIRENWDDLKDSPIFIEKATLPDISPLILNKENITFNQIKTEEILLDEENGSEWVYLISQAGHDLTTSYTPVNSYDIATDSTIFGELITNKSLDEKIYDSTNYKLNVRASAESEYEDLGLLKAIYDFSYDVSTNDIVTNKVKNDDLDSHECYLDARGYSTTSYPQIEEKIKNWVNKIDVSNYINASYGYDSQDIHQWDGKKVLYNNKVYLVEYNNYSLADHELDIDVASRDGALLLEEWVAEPNPQLSDRKKYIINTNGDWKTTVAFKVKRHNYSITSYPISETQVDITIPVHRIEGQPYGITAIPWDDYEYFDKEGNKQITNSGACRMAISQLLVSDDDPDVQFIYDQPKLPYAPVVGVPKAWSENGNGVLRVDSNGFAFISLSSDTVKRDINKNWSYNVNDPKIENQCDMWRLVSPNGSNSYEFSMVKNNGCDGFTLDMRIKPGGSTMLIAPKWKYMYGADFDDYRGLYISGDFSLARGTTAWLQYIVNNKNYQLIQQRQVENMEANNAISNTMTKNNIDYQTKMGLMNSGIALLGGIAKQNAAAVMGGLMGGLTSSLNYNHQMLQLSYTKQMQNLAIDYTNDLFNYNLENIKAQPAQIQKIDAFDANYKKYPFLEYYTCTGKEKEILREKLKWNGMTVMAIGTIAEYLTQTESYIKGKLIRFNGNLSTNEFNALSEELDKGIYTLIK